ncbi:MaoC/PaaZ C-terminal domain-containing protein [Spongiactinospora sp. TRM90649]|uniref:MaoC family dehydratase n=1 Tax=Spongiactinospora sp. TRM90649 TaxID=3031114 RepID=UPI0023F641EA|nr:MaoC/PaaZ C-terminal domain-containing protein [Spongiactinospora sp. TRM90649]MDF5758299.1 MaoC/PaaZ C-terminal domain-containing protein [Spongiactinospora sp. TRM90649]
MTGSAAAAGRRPIPAVRHFGDLTAGETHVSAGRTVTEADIVSFAGLSGDFNPLHTDEQWAAANTPYGGRIAHGLLVLSISSGLRTPGIDELNVLGYLNVERAMVAPTRAGDTIRATQTIAGLRPSRSRPGSGVVTVEVTVADQDGTVVQRGTDVLLVGGARDDR